MPHKDLEARRAYERERHRRRTAERQALGICPKCGHGNPAPGRSQCESCLERARATERARYARSKTAGEPYGGWKPESRRRMARERNRKRRRERRESGALRREAGPVALCGLRRTGERSREMRALRPPIVFLLGRAQGNARPSDALHRGGTRHGRRARALGLLGRSRHVPRLRKALPGGSGSHRRRSRDCDSDCLGVRAGGRSCTCRRPAAGGGGRRPDSPPPREAPGPPGRGGARPPVRSASRVRHRRRRRRAQSRPARRREADPASIVSGIPAPAAPTTNPTGEDKNVAAPESHRPIRIRTPTPRPSEPRTRA